MTSIEEKKKHEALTASYQKKRNKLEKPWDKLHKKTKDLESKIENLWRFLICAKYYKVSILTTTDIQTIHHDAADIPTSESTGILESHLEAGNVVFLVSTRAVIFPHGPDKWWYDRLSNSDLPHKLFLANERDLEDSSKGWRDLYEYLHLPWLTEEELLLQNQDDNSKAYYEKYKHDRELMESPVSLKEARWALKKTGDYDWGDTEMTVSS